MGKTVKIAIIILAGIWIISFLTGFIFWGNAKEKIDNAEKDRLEYKTKYDSLKTAADSLDRIAEKLSSKGREYQSHIDSLENVITDLEAQRRENVIRVAELFQPDELVEEMKATFPKFRNAPMGVVRVKHPETGLYVTSFQLPMQLVSSFIADRQDLENYRRQMAALGDINLTYETYVALQDSIIKLKEEKARAYEAGLDYGMKKYEDLVQEYISTLKNPPKVEFPKVGTIVIGTAVGFAAGVATGAAVTK